MVETATVAGEFVLVMGTTVTGAGVNVTSTPGVLELLSGVMKVPFPVAGVSVTGAGVPGVVVTASAVDGVPFNASAVCVPNSATNCIASTPVGRGDTNSPGGINVGVAAGEAE